MDDRRLESTGDPGHSDDERSPWSPPLMPDDARSLVLDRNTEEGAWVSFAAGLDSSRLLHRATAWAMLLVLLGAPVLMQLWGWVHEL